MIGPVTRPTLAPLTLALALTALAPTIAAAESLTITSTAFATDGEIPAAHTCDGGDRSPPLAFSGVPAAAGPVFREGSSGRVGFSDTPHAAAVSSVSVMCR